MGLLSRKGPSGFSASSTAEEVTQGIDGTGLTAIVTGATSGLGLETSRVLALRGVHVVMAVRNTSAGKNVKEAILKEIPSARVDVMELDLSSLASVRKFGEEYNSLCLPLNILINNAGVVTPFKLSQDNIELHFATNHLGHFLLTNLLLETMKHTSRESNREGRIVNLSSMCHQYVYREGIRFDKINDESSYYKYLAYGQSKLANVLHANELTRRLKEEGTQITVNSLHPGSIQTNIVRIDDGILHYIAKVLSVFIKPFMKTIQQGAATTCFVALHPQVKGVSGEYFADCNIAKPSDQAKDADLATKLWDFSLSLTDLNSAGVCMKVSDYNHESIVNPDPDMFAGGTDTTHTVLEWAMTELLRRPKVMRRLQNEVRGIVGNRDLTEDDLVGMDYLRAVIKETLRLHPPFSVIFRLSTEDVTIKGYNIKANTRVILNMWQIGRDPKSYNKVEEFEPERFLNSPMEYKGNDFQFIPFGVGRRGCPGTHFAISATEIVLASLVHEFDWAPPSGAEPIDIDMTESTGATTHRKHPLKAIASPYFSCG
ncbi:hypothetical protein ACLB2K_051364 [Fragaria x ananassa]